MTNMHLSYSQLGLYNDCPRRWQAAYRQGNKGVSTDSLLFGTAVHLTIERYVKREVLSPAAGWPDAWAEVLARQDLSRVDWGETSDEELGYIGGKMFQDTTVQATLEPLRPKVIQGQPAIERYFEWIVEGVPVPVVGYIDMIGDDGVPIDFKTARVMWPDTRAAKETQPAVYLAALEQLDEHDHGFLFRHIVVTRSTTPTIRIFTTQRSPEEIPLLEDRVRKVWRGISSGEFPPNPRNPWCASCPIYWDCKGAGVTNCSGCGEVIAPPYASTAELDGDTYNFCLECTRAAAE